MGMQLNVSDHQYRDPKAREHRVRLWWTAYTLDRTCASKIGLPVSIADDDIEVDLPSADGLDDHCLGDFEDVEYEVRSVELSRIATTSTRQIYSRRSHRSPFSQRVQTILKDLDQWMATLPIRFHLQHHGTSQLREYHVVHLHLRFNQVYARQSDDGDGKLMVLVHHPSDTPYPASCPAYTSAVMN